MLRLNHLSNARFQQGAESFVPEYLHLTDVLSNQALFARKLPHINRIARSLDHWMTLDHPNLTRVYRYLDVDSHYLAILAPVPQSPTLSQMNPMTLKKEAVFGIFRRLASVFHFLADRELCFPHLDLARIFYTDEGLRILGHETAFVAEAPVTGEGITQLDLRYAAPELVRTKVKTPQSDIYHLAALMHHFLLDNRNRTEKDGLSDRWQDNLKPILSEMMQPNPRDRLSFEGLWRRLNQLPGDGALGAAWIEEREHPAVSCLKTRLAATQESARAVALQLHPGRERVSRLLPFVQHAEKEGYLVFHSWAGPGQEQFAVVNEIIAMLKSVVAQLDRPDLAVRMEPLSRWNKLARVAGAWRTLLASLLPTLCPSHCRGLVLLIEHIQHLDGASLKALIQFSSWLTEVPFLLVLSGHSFNHGRFGELKARLPFSWDYVLPTPLNKSRAAAMVWHPLNRTPDWLEKGLAETGHDENLLLYWMRDQLGEPGVFKVFLERNWQYLSETQQEILQVLACSERALTTGDLRYFVDRPTTALRRLARGKFISEQGGWAITIPALRRFCFRKVAVCDVPTIRRRLYQFECEQAPRDPVQSAFLAHFVAPGDLEAYLAVLGEAIFHRFETDLLWRLAHLFHAKELEPFRPFGYFARVLSGVPVRNRAVVHFPFLVEMTKGFRLRGKSPARAIRAFLQAASKKSLNRNQRAFMLLKAAETASVMGDHLVVSRALRRFQRMDLSDLDERVKQEWCIRFAGAMMIPDRPYKQLMELDKQHPLYRWLVARQLMLDGDFTHCLAVLDEVLPSLKQHRDLDWRGFMLKFYGNACYRNYLPEKAIAAYEAAGDCFRQTQNTTALDQIRFNLAGARQLAGHFDTARVQFHEIYTHALDEGDETTRCQSLYYMMVCDLFQNDIAAFEPRFREHATTADRTHNFEERVKGLALRLHLAPIHAKGSNLEDLSTLEKALKRAGSVHELLADEVNVARRLAFFALGKPDPPMETPYPRHTRWRHQLIDYLTGKEEDFAGLYAQIGQGYFGAFNFFLLKVVIEADLLPKSVRSRSLAKAFEKHMRTIKGHFGLFLNKYFGHVQGMGEVDRAYWEEAIGVLEDLGGTPQNGNANTIMTTVKHFWPHDHWGILRRVKNTWQAYSYFGYAPVEGLVEQLSSLDAMEPARPLVLPLYQLEGGCSKGLLLFPLLGQEKAVLWLTHNQLAGQDLAMHFRPLFRFYGQLLMMIMEGQDREVGTSEVSQDHGIVGRSPALQNVLKKINQYGNSNLNIYIWGESGTGKELAARAIHLSSDRAKQPFRAVNCSHFPKNLVESELFGHIRGAFTGAVEQRAGVLELADGGTLFLDEIGDIGPKVQSLLLRVIQEGEFSRVGEHQVRKVDIRFVTATNKNIHEMIDKGLFREDLYFRLVEEEINLPPLRKRFEDLPLLVNHFVEKYQPERKPAFTSGFYDHLRCNHWPGNIRELESYVRKLLVKFPEENTFGAGHKLGFLRAENSSDEKQQLSLEEHIHLVRKKVVEARLRQFGGNRTRTAESLGISRQALIKIIARYKLE